MTFLAEVGIKDGVNLDAFSALRFSLDAAGAVRALGTLTLIATGLGGTSAMRASFNWREIG